MSLTIATNTIFECPHCKETIDASSETCRFCGAAVDREAAQKAADLLAKVNRACSDASYMRTCALALPVFFVLRFVPFLWIFGWGFIALCFVIPIWSIVWWSRYGSVKADDADYLNARTTVKVAGAVVSAVLVFLVILPFAFGMLLASINASRPGLQ